MSWGNSRSKSWICFKIKELNEFESEDDSPSEAGMGMGRQGMRMRRQRQTARKAEVQQSANIEGTDIDY